MLELRNITKDYPSGDEVVRALKGVSIRFRDSEFVSILGQSGCGKTTLLNIIGGLDHYTSGDLLINGRSTTGYTDKDWDTYRNHSVGFVFQSYNLIAHQTVLANVELALTISGVGRRERRRRATEALEAVGLGDQIHKKPNQLSGGQMQRVAIARALVNNPDIVLADEPTGALDSQTSVQVMEILKKVSADRLVIMVTHNPELAGAYSTRVVRLKDGVITSDTDPFAVTPEEEAAAAAAQAMSKRDRRRAEREASRAAGKGKKRMSLGTALGLSMRNLMTKKGRTILTAFAGSIGIIGIALILSLSNGTQRYINQVEQDTLSSYPITIESENVDMSALMQAMGGLGDGSGALGGDSSSAEADAKPTAVTTNNVMTNIISRISTSQSKNDLASFRDYLENGDGHRVYDLANDVRYDYSDTPLYVYSSDTSEGALQVEPSTLLANAGLTGLTAAQSSDSAGDQLMSGFQNTMSMGGSSSVNVWEELMNNDAVIDSQYEVLSGRMPQAYNEVVLITTKDGTVSDYLLYALGMKDQSEVKDMFETVAAGDELSEGQDETYSFDDFVGMKFKLVLPSDRYEKQADGTWADESGDSSYMKQVVDNAEDLTVVGVIRPADNAAISEGYGSIGYRSDLVTHVIDEVGASQIAREQEADPATDVFTGLPFASSADGDASSSADGDGETTGAGASSAADEAASSAAEGAGAQLTSEKHNNEADEAAGTAALGAAREATATDSAATGAETDPTAEVATPAADAGTQVAPAAPTGDAAQGQGATTQTATLGGIASQVAAQATAAQAQQQAGVADANQAQATPQAAGDAATAQGAQAAPTVTMDQIEAYIQTLPADQQALYQQQIDAARASGMTDDQIAAQYSQMMGAATAAGSSAADATAAAASQPAQAQPATSDSTYEKNLAKIGVSDVGKPSSIEIYAKDFNDKEEVTQLIDDYNAQMRDEGHEDRVIQYTDYVGLMMSSVRTVIDAISYILIAFVAISLVVSSIMIGIITYISVLERTKEIGILRSIGASKRDVSRVFNAETFVIGLIAGVLGIVVTVLLDIPANAIIANITGVHNLAQLPWEAAIILIAISVALTLIGGLIPAHLASKRDPVLALRTE